jgi:hypothetical protein
LATNELAVLSQQLAVSYFLLHHALNLFYQKQHDCRPPPILLFSLSSIEKKKLKGRHFDTTELIEAESQAVLTVLTEHDF